MEHLFTYSLRKYLDDYFPEISRAVIIEDGIVLTGYAKPFASIMYLGDNVEIEAAGRRSITQILRYQIGIYTRSVGERAILATALGELLRNPDGIPTYDIKTGLETKGRFVIDVEEYTPMNAQDSATETTHNHGYFIIAIEILRDVGASTFTQ